MSILENLRLWWTNPKQTIVSFHINENLTGCSGTVPTSKIFVKIKEQKELIPYDVFYKDKK